MIHQIAILFLIVGVKAVFSASDTAFTYLNRAEITQLAKKDKKAKKIKSFMDSSNRFFGIIEVGINMAELISSAYASLTIMEKIADLLEQLPIAMPQSVIYFIAAFIVTIFLAYILLVFGGVLPKKIARNNPKKVAYSLINILWVVAAINRPFEKLIMVSDKFFSKLFHIPQEPQEKLTEKQIKMILLEGKEEGVIASIEKRILFNALKADDMMVKDIMIPMEKVDCINIEDSFENVLANIEKYKFTRMPVYQGEKSKIVGIFNMKDIAIEYAKNKTVNTDLKLFLRKVKWISQEEKIFSAFQKLQKDSQVFAIVIDNDNKAIGAISIEDILEKIVGKIFDEYDEKLK